MQDHEQPASRRKGSLVGTVKAVAAAFFGVRGRGAHEKDLSNLNPIHVIGVGIALAALFVVALVAVVRLVAA
jgi:hypothetical protein